MKKYGLMLIGVLSFGLSAASAPKTSQALAAYDAGNYEAAQTIYSSISDKTPSTWYALGNCAYRSGRVAHAIALWQRAVLVGGDAEIRSRCEHNQACACQKLGLAQSEQRWWHALDAWYARIPLLYVQLLFLLVWFAVLLFVYPDCFVKKIKKRAVVASVAGILLFGSLLAYRYVLDASVSAVVVCEEQVLYAGPGSDYPVKGHAASGQNVTLCDRRGEWYKVSTADGTVGWITRGTLMMVRP
jgi:uncharacterized protein YgiM (DUF1202 family)